VPPFRFVVGNWKCNKSLEQAQTWLAAFAKGYRERADVRVIIAPPLLWLAPLAEQLKPLALSGVSLAAQDLSPFPPGGYTGAIAADMLKGIAEHAIVGHAERRRYFHETAQDVTNKVSEAIDAGIKPIICVDKTYAMSQLTQLGELDCEHLIVAYCPVAPMGYREAEAPDKVAEATAFISQIQPGRPIIYGGAVSAENAARYSSITGISGVLVGSASLGAEEFLAICQAVAG